MAYITKQGDDDRNTIALRFFVLIRFKIRVKELVLGD